MNFSVREIYGQQRNQSGNQRRSGDFCGEKTKINEAKEHVEQAKIQIQRFENELKDIDVTMELNIEIDKFMLFMDVFFDSAVMDVVVQSRIKELKKQVLDAIDRIERVMEVLKQAGTYSSSSKEKSSSTGT